MCRSVPQIAVLRVRISRSFGPISGTGTRSIHSPASRLFFTSPRIAAVGGWVDVRNKQDNWLTRMQVVRYWYAYHFMKNLEWGFRRVLCLSGCLTAYRRSVLIELEPVLESRSICGVAVSLLGFTNAGCRGGAGVVSDSGNTNNNSEAGEYSTYDGSGGVAVNTFWRRLLYASGAGRA